MKVILNYALSLGCGLLLALGVASLIGLVFPGARIRVFVVLGIWWLWIGNKYALARDRRQF